MAALVCDICGGKLVSQVGGIVVCDSCGLEFDKARLKEMIQEIQGTVKIEGAVKVEGIADTTNLIERAKEFVKQGDYIRANEYAERVLDIDVTNEEAKIIKFNRDMKLIMEYIKAGVFINPIILFREHTKIGLKEAKDAINLVSDAPADKREVILCQVARKHNWK